MARKNENDVIASYETVVLEDGSVDLRITWESGKGTVFNTKALPKEVIVQLLAYGLKQKMIDKIAGRSKEGWSEEECSEKLETLFTSMKGGSFTSREAGSSLSSKLAELYAKRDELDKMGAKEYELVKRFVSKEMVKKEIIKLETKISKSSEK